MLLNQSKRLVFCVLCFLFLSVSQKCYTQDRAQLLNDTIKYQGHAYYAGKVVTLGIGSGEDKSFKFVTINTGLAKGTWAGYEWALTDIVITAVRKKRDSFVFDAMNTGQKRVGFTVDIVRAIGLGELKP